MLTQMVDLSNKNNGGAVKKAAKEKQSLGFWEVLSNISPTKGKALGCYGIKNHAPHTECSWNLIPIGSNQNNKGDTNKEIADGG